MIMDNNDYAIKTTRIINLAMKIGAELQKSGGEIARTENTVSRICMSYGLEDVHTFAMTSVLIVCVRTKNGDYVSRISPIDAYNINLLRAERLNSLSRRITENKLDISKAEEELLSVPEYINGYKKCAGYMMTAFFFCFFFGGNIKDAFCSALISVPVYFWEKIFINYKINYIIYTFIISALSGILAVLITSFGFGVNSDKIMIGIIMILIPGLSMINSFRDLLFGDTASGILRLAETIMIASAITMGFYMAYLFGKV